LSLSKTLQVANERLDHAQGLLELHSDEIIAVAKENKEYRGLYEDELIDTAVSASQHSTNARTQFYNYEDDFKKFLQGEQTAEQIMEQHDVAPNLQQYIRAYESAVQVTKRRERLEQRIKALSHFMEAKEIGGLTDQLTEQHPWYQEPEDASGFKKASQI